MNKRACRIQQLQIRDNLDPVYRAKADAQIREKLFGLRAYEEATHLLCYVSFRSEVDTLQILDHSLSLGKQVYCPKVMGKRQMAFYPIYSLDQLEKGAYGILEPRVDTGSHYMPGHEGKACILLPGAAFDLTGGRIGYGGGYYDFYLSNVPMDCRIGLCYEAQIVPTIEVEETDYPISYLVSEKEVYTFV